MGRRGPKAAPASLKVVRGNPGHERNPEQAVETEPQPQPGRSDPPRDLDPRAQAIWRRLAPELRGAGLLAPRYADSFRRLCACAVVCEDLESQVLSGGAVGPDRDGSQRSRAVAREYRAFAAVFHRYCAEFGLTPMAVSRLGRSWVPSSDEAMADDADASAEDFFA